MSNLPIITKGLTNRTEICVINNIYQYKFNIDRYQPSRCVERPRYPSLVVGEAGLLQNGLCHQERKQGPLNHGPNHYELIEHRYDSVKYLLGYMGLKTNDYYLYKVVQKNVEYGESFINCGSTDTIDINGIVYTSDIGSGGRRYSRPNNHISGARTLMPIYQSARSVGNGVLTWDIDVSENTFYKLILRFADFWNESRDVDIFINGWYRRKGFNIVEKASGTYKRMDLAFTVPVKSNKIELKLESRGHLNGIDVYRLEKEDVEFEEITRDNEVNDKETYLFVNKMINASEQTIKNKFLGIQKNILKSRNLFFF